MRNGSIALAGNLGAMGSAAWTAARAEAAGASRQAAIAELRDIRWLQRDPRLEHALRWFPTATGAAVLAAFAVLGYFYYTFAPAAAALPPDRLAVANDLMNAFLVLVVLVAGVPVIGRIGLRNLQHRLGTDGRTLYVHVADGRRLSLAPEQLVYDERRIAYRGLTFSLRTGNGQALYAPGEVETYLMPLLARARRLDPWSMFRYQLAHREPLLVASLVYLFLIGAAVMSTGAWRYLF